MLKGSEVRHRVSSRERYINRYQDVMATTWLLATHGVYKHVTTDRLLPDNPIFGCCMEGVAAGADLRGRPESKEEAGSTGAASG